MKVAICDDNIIIHDILKKKLELYSSQNNFTIVYYDYMSGAELINSKIEYDAIFMDYQMEQINGLETAKILRKNNISTAIIFLTGFPNIVFDAFEVNTYRFLVKPIDDEKLKSAMDSLLKSTEKEKFIFVKTEDTNKKIDINNIIYIEASNKYCFIRTKNENILCKKTLAEIEKQLNYNIFFRSHRTYLVNFSHIISHDSTSIIFDNSEKALISKLKLSSFKKAFTEYLKNLNIV